MKIKPLYGTRLLCGALMLAMLGGCSTGSGLVSSFIKRKYTKGHFCDVPAKRPAVAKNNTDIVFTGNIAANVVNNTLVKTRPVKEITAVSHKVKNTVPYVMPVVAAKHKSFVKAAEKGFVQRQPVNNVPPEQPKTGKKGLTGFILVMASIVFSFISAFFFFLALFPYPPTYIILLALGTGLLGTVLLVTGFVLCINAVHDENEKHPGLAKAGAIISGILLVTLLLDVVIVLVTLM